MHVSVILSTYNSPDWLARSVWGYAAQDERAFELVIADDGSDDATGERIEALRRETGLAIRHVWHPDVGFRKSEILNKAVEAAEGDYLIFSDGDCIPRSDFVSTHRRLARPGRFLSGGYVKLPMKVSRAVDREAISAGRATDPRWLLSRGLPFSPRLLKLAVHGALATLCDALTTTGATWNGHNASGWKRDIVAVNGFDERMRYGGQDRELGERLVNAGVRPRQIRYRAVCVHLDHGRSYRTRESLERNREIRRQTRRQRKTWTEYGIVKGKAPRPAEVGP